MSNENIKIIGKNENYWKWFSIILIVVIAIFILSNEYSKFDWKYLIIPAIVVLIIFFKGKKNFDIYEIAMKIKKRDAKFNNQNRLFTESKNVDGIGRYPIFYIGFYRERLLYTFDVDRDIIIGKERIYLHEKISELNNDKFFSKLSDEEKQRYAFKKMVEERGQEIVET